jgi:hypothetical protein
MGLKPSNVEASGTTVGRKLNKKNLMGFHSTGTPTKKESKLGILAYTYTQAMPSRERERETLKLLGFECGFLLDGFRERKLDKRSLKGEEGKVRQSETTTCNENNLERKFDCQRLEVRLTLEKCSLCLFDNPSLFDTLPPFVPCFHFS